MLPIEHNDLDDTYRRLAHPWTREQLAAAYHGAAQRWAGLVDAAQIDRLTRPLELLATATPPAATMNIAIHMVHVLPEGARGALSEELITTAEKNAADAVQRCHRALELDSEDHGYSAEEWLAVVYDIAIPLLETAGRDQEPPTVVRQAREAISWLSRSSSS